MLSLKKTKQFYNYNHRICLHVYNDILQIILQQMKKIYIDIYTHITSPHVSNKRLDTITNCSWHYLTY